MISYRPLWQTMKKCNTTTYTLRETYKISHSTVQRLQKDKHVSTYTLNRLCNYLNCGINDIIEYLPDQDTLQ